LLLLLMLPLLLLLQLCALLGLVKLHQLLGKVPVVVFGALVCEEDFGAAGTAKGW